MHIVGSIIVLHKSVATIAISLPSHSLVFASFTCLYNIGGLSWQFKGICGKSRLDVASLSCMVEAWNYVIAWKCMEELDSMLRAE